MPISSRPLSKVASPILWLVLALAFPIIVGGTVFICRSEIADCKEHHKKEKQADAYRELAAHLDAVADQGQAEHEKRTQANAHPEHHCSDICGLVTRTIEDPVGLFTMVLSYVVLLQWLWLFRQEGVLERSVSAATKSADAASSSVNVLIAAERAYVIAELHLEVFSDTLHEAITDSPRSGNEFGTVRVSVKFWNYGKTVAVITKLRGYITMPLSRIPHELIQGEDLERELPPQLGIGINCAHEEIFEQTFRVSEFVDVRNMNKIMYVVGKIEYSTIIEKDRVTSFCWHILPRIEGARLILTRGSDLNQRT